MAAIAIDVEWVTLADGRGSYPIRISIVGENKSVLMDEYVQLTDEVEDFLTEIHGITPETVKTKGISFKNAREKVLRIMEGKVVVGHDLNSDLKSLMIEDSVPIERRRDTASAKMFANEKLVEGSLVRVYNKPSLKDLVLKEFKEVIQQGKHDSVDDALWSMKLYKKYQKEPFEKWLPVSVPKGQ